MEKEDKETLALLTKIKDAPLHKGTRLTIEVSEEKRHRSHYPACRQKRRGLEYNQDAAGCHGCRHTAC